MKDLKPTNRYRSTLIENIVFLQGDDFRQYEEEEEFEGFGFSDIQYLLNWYYPGEHETNWYKAKEINTPFLGNLIKIDGYKGYFLFAKNTHIGYIGLSRVIEFSMKIID